MPGVQAGRGRIEALIQGDAAVVESAPEGILVRDLRDEAAGAQHVEDIGRAGGHHADILGKNVVSRP